MSVQGQRVEIPHPWQDTGTVEGVEVDREPDPSYNDPDAFRVVVEVDGTPFAVRGEDVEAIEP